MQRVTGRSVFEGVLVDRSIDQPAAVPTLPVALLSKAEIAAELQRVQQRRAMEAAYEAELILGLAELSSDRFDPPPDSPGARKAGWAAEHELPGVSEFFTAELGTVLNVGRGTAAFRATRAWTWRESLPATFAALRAGELDERRAGVLAEVLAHTDPAVARAVEAGCCPRPPACPWAGCATGRSRRCSTWTPPRPTGAAPGRRRPRTCASTPRPPTARPP